MSYAWQDRVWELELPSSSKLVLLALAYRADADGLCYPSMSAIARHTGMDIKTARRAVAWLEKEGYVLVHRRDRKVSIYQLPDFSNKAKLLPKKVVVDAELLPKTVVPKTVVAENNYSQNWESTTTKIGSPLLPKLVDEQVNNKSITSQQTGVDPFAPISEQLEAVNLNQSNDFLDDPLHILTAPELVRLCAKHRVRIGTSSALADICKKQILTVLAAERLIGEFKRTNYSVNYLVGMLRNFANEKGQPANGKQPDWMTDDNWQPPF